jgi:outer membrane protein, multidrug efflux system
MRSRSRKNQQAFLVKLSATALLFISCTATASSAQVKVPSADELSMPMHYQNQSKSSISSEHSISTQRWWEAFNDDVLNGLIDQALAENLDIAQALERVEQARQSWRQSKADQLPTVEGSTSANRSKTEDVSSVDRYSGQIDVRWNLDLFGTRRHSARASKAAFEAAGFNLADIRNTVAAEVARNYVDARALSRRVQIAEDTLKTQDGNLAIAQWREQAGLVSMIDVEQARGLRAQTAVSVVNLQRSLASSAHRLAVLTGQAPGELNALFINSQSMPQIQALSSIGIPADLLRLRPDVRAVEQNLIGSAERVGVAKSQLFPNLNLSGNLNSSASSFADIGELLTGNIIVSLAQTLFDGGKRRAALRSRESEARQSLTAYRSSVLSALEEVENAVVSNNAAQARLEQLIIQEKSSAVVAQLRRDRYRTGLTDFTSLLDAERSLLSARDSLASTQADVAISTIQLHLALGGGWNPQEHNSPTQRPLEATK